MKKILTLAIAAAAAFAVQAADSFFRVDFNAGKDQIVMTPEKSDSMSAATMNWVKDAEARKYTLTTASKQKISGTEWKDYKIMFVPSKSGTVNITVGGQWAAKAGDRAWILVNRIDLNGKPYANGEFKTTYKASNGVTMPNGFWLGGKSKYLPAAGEKGTPAILVNHDNRIGFNMKVEGGKKYELGFVIKAAAPGQN